MTFATSKGSEPDAIDLELALLGVEDPRLDGADLDQDRAALDAATQLFERAAPSLPRRRRRWPLVLGGALLLAAAAALAVVLPSLTAVDDGMRAMGRADVLTVDARRDGDRLWLTVTPSRAGFLSVASLQEDGAVSVLVSGAELPASPGVPAQVDGVVRLDDYLGREWLVVERTGSPPDPASVERRAVGLLPDPGRSRSTDLWVLEVTRR